MRRWSQELEAEPAVSPPADGQVPLGEAGLEQHRGVGAPGKGDGGPVFGDVDPAGGVDELLVDGLRGRLLVALQAARQQAVDAAGNDGEGGVGVDVERPARGQGVDLEALDVGGPGRTRSSDEP
jgi:hypothetical protein